MSDAVDKHLEALLSYLRQHRGFDFTGYKRPSLTRRIERRMQTTGIESFADYTDYLEVHPEEFSQLFNTILINVTEFFRDPPAWKFLAQSVLPNLLRDKAGGPIRIWSAGSASGEEAYSLAILFAEAMGHEAFRQQVKIYATDIDEDTLNTARQASYNAKSLDAIEDETLRKKYFEPAPNNRFCFRSDLRRSVLFGRHDLLQDAPISRLDLLVCRNTLMYFNAEAQSHILARFHFALNPTGYLFMGRAELLLTHSNLFTPVDLKCRIFAKVPQANVRERLLAMTPPLEGNAQQQKQDDQLKDLALDESSLSRLVVNSNGLVALANQKARMMFSLNSRDIGRPLQDLEVSYRPAELRALIEQAYTEKRTVALTSVPRAFPDGGTQYLDILVAPLYDSSNTPHGASITFVDVTRYCRMQEELRQSREETQTMNEELQSSNEELETTNEELQSSNEELETTNEELQSTNEELETMNEELQSSNEEMQAVNEELQERTEELQSSNLFLQSVLRSLQSAAVVVNPSLHVLFWNPKAEDMWGLRADEAEGKSLLNLDIGLPVEKLRGAIRPFLAGQSDHSSIILDAINRRGKPIKCRITCSPLVTPNKGPQGVIVLMEEDTA